MNDAGWKGLLEFFSATCSSQNGQQFHVRYNLAFSCFSPLTDYFSKGIFCSGQAWSSLLHKCGQARGPAAIAFQQQFPLCKLGFLSVTLWRADF